MKILHICTDLTTGGIPRFVLDICQEMGKTQEVVLATHYPEAMDQLSVDQPNFRRVAFQKSNNGISPRLFWQIARLIWREKPDVVHTHLFSLFYASPLIFLNLPSKTHYVHTIHSMADKEMPNIDAIRKLLYGRSVTAVTISDQVRQSAIDYFNGLRLPLVYNGTALKEHSAAEHKQVTDFIKSLQPTAATKLFLNIGHLCSCKNQRMLNQAAKLLRDDGYDFRIIIIGNQDDEYAKAFEAERIPEVVYHGPSTMPQCFLQHCDFFVLSSTFEGMPISLLEAIGNGCVPVCVPAGGIPTGINHPVSGLLADEISADALYRVMKQALELPPEKVREMREQSQKLFERQFTINACAAQYLDLYRKPKNREK